MSRQVLNTVTVPAHVGQSTRPAPQEGGTWELFGVTIDKSQHIIWHTYVLLEDVPPAKAPLAPDVVERALAVVAAYVPCEHGAWDAVGSGDEWAKCQDCGTQFRLKNHEKRREVTAQFLRAMDVLQDACTRSK